MSDQPVVGKIEFAPFGNLTPEARPGDWKIVAEGQNKRIKALEAERDALRAALRRIASNDGRGDVHPSPCDRLRQIASAALHAHPNNSHSEPK